MVNSILKEKLKICYKGARNYVYASDVLSESVIFFENYFQGQKLTQIDFSTHNMAHNQIELILFDDPPEIEENIHAVLNFNINNKKYYSILLETDEEINCRNEYPEDEIFNTFSLDADEQSVSTRLKYEFTILDVLTSLNKYLLSNMFPEITQGWLSVRTKIENELNYNYKELKVSFVRNFSNKYYQSKLFVDGDLIGYLYFSIKRK